MTDNLLQLIDLQPGLLLADLIDKTKRCAITWDQVSHTTFHSSFVWNNDWYDVYVTLMRGSYGLDLNRNERNVLSINSYVNDQVAVLYYVITDSMDDNEIKQIIQDVNSLISARNIKRESGLGGVVVSGSSTVAFYKYVIGGVKTGGTASLVAAPASFTNDATAEFDGYSYSNFDETNPTLVIGSADNHIPFYYGQGLFAQNDPTNKRGTNFALPPYVRFDNYSGQFVPPFTPKTATYSIVNEVVQPTVVQPSSDNFNLLGGQPNSETVMLINIGSPNGVGYYKLFLNLIFKTSDSSTLSIRAFTGYTNNTSPTYMPSSTSDLPITVTDAVAEIELGGDSDILAVVEISEVIGEVISQPGWLTTNGIMLQVRASLAEDTYSLPYNSLANGSGVYGSPDIIELNPINFTSRFNSYIRFTMNQSGIADICTLSVVKDEEASVGDSAIVVKAVKDINIAWPTSSADLDDYVLTDASVTYSVSMADEIGTKYDIEVTSVVQEIIDQDGWVAGNAIMFVLTDGHQFRTYHVQQIISEVSIPVLLAAQENVDYDNATLTFQPRSVSIGGMKTGGTAIIGEGAVLYMVKGSLEVLSVSGNVRTILGGLPRTSCVRVDQGYGKIFWTQVEVNESAEPSGTVMFTCGTDGSGATDIVSLPTYDGIRGFDLDRVNRKIYLVVDRNWNGSTSLVYYVMKCDYDGSNLQDVHNGTNTDLCTPTSLSVDVENGYVFWCDSYGLDKGYVHRCDLDGSNYTTLLSTSGYVRAICIHQSMLYLGGSGLLAKVNEQGSNEILLPHTGLSVIASIDINESGVMYISDIGVNKVVSTDLDGNNMTVLVDDSSQRNAICVASGVIVLDEHETGSGGVTLGGAAFGRRGVPTAITGGSGTLTMPSNYDKIFIEIWGSGGMGGDGGTTGNFHAGGGGGAGGYTSNLFTVTPGQQFNYSIVNFGATTVTTGAFTMIANAGQDGQDGQDVVSGNATGGAGGTFVNGDGHNGQDGFDSSGNAGGSGGSVYVGFNGATSGYGSGTGGVGTTGAGNAGMAPGGGGPGTGNGQGAGGLPGAGWLSFTPYYND